MNEFEALKRIRQETAPATYNPDFNKEECLDVIEQALLELKAIKEAKQALLKTEKLEKAIKCIEKRSIYSIELKEYVFVNKLIYWEDDLMIIGYSDKSQFKVEDYGITWKEVLV